MRLTLLATALPLVLLNAQGVARAGGASWGGPADGAPAGVTATARLPLALPSAPPAREVVRADATALRPRALTTTEATGLPTPGTRISVRTLYQPDTRIGPALGDYSVTRATAELRIARNLSSRFQLAGDLSLERGRYEFSDAAALVPTGAGDLDGDMTGVRLGLGGSWSLSRSLGVTLIATGRWTWMDGADMGDGFQPGAIAAVRLRLFGSTDVFVGGSYIQGLEGDAYILPVLGLGGGASGKGSRWHVEARGPGVSVAYDLTACLSLGLVAGYERRDVRLAPDARLPDGVLRERRLPVGLELGWRVRQDSFLLLSAGASLWNRLTLTDRDGNDVRVETTDPAPYLQLEWTARF